MDEKEVFTGVSVHYSILPLETVFSNQEQSNHQLDEVTIQGMQMQIRRTDEKSATIERIFSTDPNHYLNPKWAPGAKIHISMTMDE